MSPARVRGIIRPATDMAGKQQGQQISVNNVPTSNASVRDNRKLVKGPASNQSSDKQADPKHFRLLELPPELWSRICRFAILDQPMVIIKGAAYPADVTQQVRQPSLTRVCRLLRKETLPVFYASVAFVILDSWADVEGVIEWLDRIGANNRRSLKQLYLASAAKSPGAPYFGEFGEENWWEAEVKVLDRFEAEFTTVLLAGWCDTTYHEVFKIKLSA